MKRYLHKYSFLRPICAILLMAAGLLTVRAGTETSVRLYDTSGITLTQEDASDGNTYSRLKWSGLASSSEVGAPELPVEYIRFIVPVYSNNFRATVSNVSATPARQLSTKILPVQKPVTTNEASSVPFTAPASAAYSSAWPTRAEVVEDGFIDGCNHIVTVAVYPTTYTPALNRITTATSLTVTLQYDECTAADLTDTPLFPPSRSQYVKLPSLVVNAERVSNRSYAPAIETLDESFRGWYYIIAPENLVEAFDDLARWKRQKGYNVQVTSIESIYQRYRPGTSHSCTLANNQSHNVNMVDSAASLRTYLQDEFAKNGSFFCLLAGDWRTPMPIRYVNSNTNIVFTDTTDEYKYKSELHGSFSVPTDIYFADITYNWVLSNKLNKDVYSSNYPSSFSPDIAVGRLLCATEKEVNNYLPKLFQYEMNPGYGDDSYLGNAMIFEQCVFEGTGPNKGAPFAHSSKCMIENTYQLYANETYKKLKDVFPSVNQILDNTHERYYRDNTVTYDIKPQGDYPEPADILTAMEESGYCSWNGHGSPHGIGVCCDRYTLVVNKELAYIYTAPSRYGLDNLYNPTSPNIVYSMSCTNAPMDVYLFKSFSNGTCTWEFFYEKTNMGRALTTDYPYGAAAALMNSREGFIGSSTALERAFLEEIRGNQSKIGIAENHSKLTTKSKSNHVIATHYLIGDPELEVWLNKPLRLEKTVSIDESMVNVWQIDTIPLYLSLVVDNESSRTWKSKATGNLYIPRPTGDYCLSAWKSGCLPIIKVFAQQGILENANHKYLAKDAFIGKDGSDRNTYCVNSGGELSVKAVNRIDCYYGMTIGNGGTVNLECRETVYLHGGLVKAGGTLIINAPNVEFGEGFTVEKGGILQIGNR